MSHSRLPVKERASLLLTAALEEAVARGFSSMTRAGIAHRAQVSEGLVSHYLGTMEAMRRSVMRQAIAVECLPVIAEGLARRDKHALKASPELRARAAASIG